MFLFRLPEIRRCWPESTWLAWLSPPNVSICRLLAHRFGFFQQRRPRLFHEATHVGVMESGLFERTYFQCIQRVGEVDFVNQSG